MAATGKTGAGGTSRAPGHGQDPDPHQQTGAKRRKKRAIALGGGGPVAGFLIGALEALETQGIAFDVWSLSCIGAWVGIHYNQAPAPGRASQTYAFFREHAYRDTASYEGFPINRAFAPNFGDFATAWTRHLFDPQTYVNATSFSAELPAVAKGWQDFLTAQTWRSPGDLNAHLLNNLLAVHPATRLLASLVYRSEINGLSNIYCEQSSLLKLLELGTLDLIDEPGLAAMGRGELERLAAGFDPASLAPERARQPEIYHNAWRVADDSSQGALQLFNNKWASYRQRGEDDGRRDYLPISAASLCACSALPYIEQTVRIPNDDGREYSEGALIDTVNFLNLVEDHQDLDEIWVCRIVDARQLRPPKNLHDSLSNLCQQFAAEVGDNDVRLFRNHLRKRAGRVPRVIEIPLAKATRINYRWDHANLDAGRDEGFEAVSLLLQRHPDLLDRETVNDPWPRA